MTGRDTITCPTAEKEVATEAKSPDAESETAANTAAEFIKQGKPRVEAAQSILITDACCLSVDEKQLEKEIEEHKEILMDSSIVSSEFSPVQRRMLCQAALRLLRVACWPFRL